MKLSGVQIGGVQNLAPVDIEAAGRVNRAETQADMAMVNAGITVTNTATAVIDNIDAFDTAKANSQYMTDMTQRTAKYQNADTITREDLEGMGITPKSDGDVLPMYEYLEDVARYSSEEAIKSSSSSFRFSEHGNQWSENQRVVADGNIAKIGATMPQRQKRYITNEVNAQARLYEQQGNYGAAIQLRKDSPINNEKNQEEIVRLQQQREIVAITSVSVEGTIAEINTELKTLNNPDYSGSLTTAQKTGQKKVLNQRKEKLQADGKAAIVANKAHEIVATLEEKGATYTQQIAEADKITDPTVRAKAKAEIDKNEARKKYNKQQLQEKLYDSEYTQAMSNPSNYKDNPELDLASRRNIRKEVDAKMAGYQAAGNDKRFNELEAMASEDWNAFKGKNLNEEPVNEEQRTSLKKLQNKEVKPLVSVTKMMGTQLKQWGVKEGDDKYDELVYMWTTAHEQAVEANDGKPLDSKQMRQLERGLSATVVTDVGYIYDSTESIKGMNEKDLQFVNQWLEITGGQVDAANAAQILEDKDSIEEAVARANEHWGSPTAEQYMEVLKRVKGSK